MSPPECQRVELSSAEVTPDGESFIMGFLGANSEVHRLELPFWAIHQLMRILPRLDAALLQARQAGASAAVHRGGSSRSSD